MMLYIHLPFCKEKCAYCAFCSGKFSFDTQAAYVEKIIEGLYALVKGKEISTVYIGGGTPSVLPLLLWEKLLGAIEQCVDVARLSEFTVECNPESTAKELLTLLKKGGVNRLSFGVQSLVDSELAAIGRLHNAEKAREAILLADALGFENISADLIYGLPGQTPEHFAESLDGLLSLPISHLSCYNLQIEEGTPLYENREKYTFPDEETEQTMLEKLLEKTRKAGFIHYEISNFAKPGREAVHNSGYWCGTDYLGLGAAAHSKLGDRRCAFGEDVLVFAEKKDLEFDTVISLTEADKREEEIMLGLRTDKGIPTALVPPEKQKKYIDFGLAFVKKDRFILTERGFLLSNAVIADLI